MTFTSGTEGQPDYYAYELALAARKVVIEVTPVQPGQQVLQDPLGQRVLPE